MPQRLVYSPKAYVYTKNANGALFDLSPFVTAGQVDRKINQVSTAQITLRNPNRMFTKPSDPGGATFHPQDPITIYLERIQGYPVRVFTGYLDSTPYYQLYPGTVVLNASCTLKRLLYSFFDPSLPYVISFFEQYGWVNTGSGSLISSSGLSAGQTTTGGATQAEANAGAKPFNDLQDGSLGKLLWAVLYNMGQWEDADIYIEALPTGADGIAARMATLMQQMDQSQAVASKEFTQFMESVVGTGSQGSGGGSGNGGSSTPGSGGSTTAQKIFNYFEPLVGGKGAAGIVGNAGQEIGGGTLSGINPGSPPAGAFGFVSSPLTSADADITSQCHKVWTTIQSGSWLSGLKNATSPSNAADVFELNFERAGTGGTVGGPAADFDIGAPEPTNEAGRRSVAEQAYTQYNTSSGNAASNNSNAGGSSNAGNDSTNAVTLSTETVQVSNSPQGTKKKKTTSSANSTGGGDADGAKVSRIQAMIDAAQAITNSDYPYAYAGGHPSAGTPSSGSASESGGPTVLGFDCSGSVAAVLSAAHAGVAPGSACGNDATIFSQVQAACPGSSGPGAGTPEVTLWDLSGTHIFMSINGKYFGTSDGEDGNASQKNGGAGWLDDGHPDTSTYTPWHFSASYLNDTVSYAAPKTSKDDSGAAGAGGGSGGSGGSGGTTSAAAFVPTLELPSMQDMVTALALGAEGKGLMHDQQLLPFIQQLCTASMRSFQSLPNGDFYAFYPDYFGEMGAHAVYWNIDDIEIMSGGINLSDDGLATHVYAVGDNSWPVDNEMINQLFSAGTISVYNAFLNGALVTTNTTSTRKSTDSLRSQAQTANKKGKQGSAQSNAKANGATQSTEPGADLTGNLMTSVEAANFVTRYGARPLVQDYPMVRSAIYEMLLAYQQFLMAWSTQFQTNFTFTFMPEIFPGGKVGFPTHGIQMYVEEVVHQFDYSEAGFTTTATLSAPAIYPTGSTPNPYLPVNMVKAMAEPIQGAPDPGTAGGTAQVHNTKAGAKGAGVGNNS
jgi:hypothetical protein